MVLLALLMINLRITDAKLNFHLSSLQQKEKIYTATYESEALPLRPGEFVYTDIDETPVPMPCDFPYAITGFIGEIIDENETSIPLSEVYDHHWILKHSGFKNVLCLDGPQYIFGIGAESRNTPVHFPQGYGYRVSDTQLQWGANIHLLRTQYLDGEKYQATKECNECYYALGKGCRPEDNGTFTCCGDSDNLMKDDYFKCPISADSPTTAKNYKLRYTLNYTEYENVKEARVGVWSTPDCNTYYGIETNDTAPEQVSSTIFHISKDAQILVAIGHQHVGAINISLFVNDEFVCASYPRYGTLPHVAGNEQGYLVQMSTCFEKDMDPNQPELFLHKDDYVRLDSWYFVGSDDPRIAPLPGGGHLNVMGYMCTVFTVEEEHSNPSFATPISSS